MRGLKERFRKSAEIRRPPMSWRRPLLDLPPKMNSNEFEKFYISTIGTAGLVFPVSEDSMAKLAAVANRALRSTSRVDIETTGGHGYAMKIHATLGPAFLNRLWSDDLAFFWKMDEPHFLLRKYLGRGGAGLFAENYGQERKNLNFLERPDVAVEHLRYFREFMNSIPSKSKDFGNVVFPPFKGFDFSEAISAVESYLSLIRQYAPLRFQSHLSGVPQRNLRFVDRAEIKKGNKEVPVAIVRGFPWDPDTVKKMQIASERGVPVARPVALLTMDSADFLVMTDEGTSISRLGWQNSEKLDMHLVYKLYGGMISRMHSVGVCHDDPAPRNVVFKIPADDKLRLTLIDYEDIWISEHTEPIPYPDRELGMRRILEEVYNTRVPYNCLTAFAEGYGKEEFRKAMGRTY